MNSLKISLITIILPISLLAQSPPWSNIGNNFPGDSLTQNFSDVCLTTPYDMWWISSGVYPEIYHLTEIGLNWETQYLQSVISTINYNEISSTALACGIEGKIYVADDLYNDWLLYDSIDATIRDACVTYNNFGWKAYICGDSGAVWSLTESALTNLNSGLEINFKKVSSRLIDNVWLCGGSLVYYYDGNSFIEKFSAPAELNSIIFKYLSHIWVAGQNGYIAYSSDNGQNWAEQNNPDIFNRTLNDIFFSQIYNWGVGWAVGDNGLILKTTNFGNTWEIEAEGITNNNLKSIHFSQWADFFGMTFGPGIIVGEHKTVLFYDIVVSVEEERNQPEEYYLSQNYPNPFNLTTKIKYSVPQTSNVVIKVFDVLGNEIATLINEKKPSGTYEIEFNATELPSGIYFYQLKTGTYRETKKMILLK